MIPMPEFALAIQDSMAQLQRTMERTELPKGTPRLLPQMLFLIAAIGDQELTGAQIITRGYWHGRSITHPITFLEKSGLVERRKGERKLLFKLTESGLEISERIRKSLAEDKENFHAVYRYTPRSDDDFTGMGLPI